MLEEPYASIAHVRFREGRRQQCQPSTRPISIQNAAEYFREFYSERKSRGLPAEKKKCIYLRDDFTLDQVMANLVSNPVKALVASGYFFYNEGTQVFAVSPEIWSVMKRGKKASLTKICKQKLKEYCTD